MTKDIGVLRGQSKASDHPLELTVAGVSVLERPCSVLFSGLELVNVSKRNGIYAINTSYGDR